MDCHYGEPLLCDGLPVTASNLASISKESIHFGVRGVSVNAANWVGVD
jgi:hypothetical protein